jgi:long-chain fatty acid transport protein
MSKLQVRNLVGLFVVLALAAASASATNGYYTTGTGTKSKGQAGAGSANPQEVMSLATNPAGIAFVDEAIEAGLSIFSPMRDYKTTPSQAPGACFAPGQCLLTIGPNDLSSKNEFFPIPYVGMNWKLTDVDNLALAFYARGGMNTKWEGGTVTYDPYFGGPGSQGAVTLPGTFGANTAGVDLMQGFLNLTYARRISDQFSVGASAIFAMQRFEARGLANFAPFTRTYVSTFNPATGGQMPKNLTNNGHDMSYGYGASVGLQWNPTDMFSFAAAYTTKMSMGKFGDYADLFAEKGGFDMPSTWTVGVALKPNDRWAFMFDVQDISYSDAASVSNGIANLFNCPILGGTDLEGCLGGKRGAGFGWDNMTVSKLGASWQCNELNFSFMYAPEVKIKGPQNFDPTQTVELSMSQFELEVSYSWKR